MLVADGTKYFYNIYFLGRIESDKMGASNFFWCFPSAAAAKRKRKREELDSELEQLNVKRQKLDEELQVVSVGKEPTEEREELLALRKELQGKKSELDAKVEKIGECDPKRIEAYSTYYCCQIFLQFYRK